VQLPPMDYLAPADLSEALAAKARLGDEAVWLAGGTDLLPRAKQGIAAARTVISLKHLAPELSGVRVQDGRITIGALTTLKAAGEHPELSRRLPGLRDALASIGAETLQQSVGTVGGNLCADTRCLYLNQSPAWRAGLAPCFKLGGEVCHPGGASADRCRSVCQSDGAVMLMALQAEAQVASPQGQRTVALDELYTGKGETPLALQADELLTGVSLELGDDPLGTAYHKLALRGALDYPLLSAAAALWLRDGVVSRVRVALGAVYAAPLVLIDAVAPLVGQEPTPERLAQAARKAGGHAEPFLVDNVGADLQWRKDMVRVVVARALEQAVQRAKGGA